MSVINTNTKSLVAQSAINTNSRALGKAMEQLSTGVRINSAADDAAGLSITSKMTSQIRGLNQAVRNANDGISLLQTAEGAMVEMSNMLQRMRELAVQSASDTNTSDERTYLNDEFQQLKNEIDRIAKNTQWNGVNILDGNDNFGTVSGAEQTVKFQVGANASQTIDINFKEMKFTSSTSAGTSSTATLNLAAITAAGADVSRITGTIGTINFDIDTTALSANPTSAEATTLASELQTGIRKYSGLENVTVSAVGEVLTFTDTSGRALSSFALKKQDNTAAAPTGFTAGSDITYSNGTAGTGAATAGSLFDGGAAIHSLSITSQSTANSAITAVDLAVKAINQERSKFGAVINRLTYASDNLSNVARNATESRSRVLDTDYAAATTELARTQIISQAATAMLAQANQQPQTVLSLLQ